MQTLGVLSREIFLCYIDNTHRQAKRKPQASCPREEHGMGFREKGQISISSLKCSVVEICVAKKTNKHANTHTTPHTHTLKSTHTHTHTHTPHTAHTLLKKHTHTDVTHVVTHIHMHTRAHAQQMFTIHS